MGRRSLALLALTALTGWSGAPSDRDVVPSFIGRLAEADGSAYSGSFTVEVSVMQSSSSAVQRPPRLVTRTFDGTTDSEGRFDFRARLHARASELGPLELRVAPHATDRLAEHADAALTDAHAARAWLGTRALEPDDEREWVVDCGTLVFEPAPVVASLHFVSRHTSLEVVLTGSSSAADEVGRDPIDGHVLPVLANTWVEFHSWSRAVEFRLEGTAGAREHLFAQVVERGARREVALTPVSCVCVARTAAAGEPLDETLRVALVATGAGAAPRPTPLTDEQAPNAEHPLLRGAFALADLRGGRLAHDFANVPDGTYRAELWSDAALARGEPLASAEFTAPHVGWVAFAPRE